MTAAMLAIGYVLCGLGGASLTAMAMGGRPTRGENMVGTHLITGPMALAFTLGALLVALATGVTPTALAVAFYATLPGLAIGMTILPLAAYGRRTGIIKLAVPCVVAAPFAIGHGAALHPMLPNAGAAVLSLIGAASTWMMLGYRVRRFISSIRHRLFGRFRQRAPSGWDLQQGNWQREQWQKVPADASVEQLLPHARALAPDVREACHARLLAHPDLVAGLIAGMQGGDPGMVFWYLTFHYPRAKAPFAKAIGDALAAMRATMPQRLRHDDHPRPWTGELVPALECATAVLLDGGDVRDELQAWQRELAAMPKFAGLAKQIGRWLKKAG